MQRSFKFALVIIIAFAAVQHAYETYDPAASWRIGETVTAGGAPLSLNDIPVRYFVNPSNSDGLSVNDVMGAMRVGSDVWTNPYFEFDPPIQLPGIDPESGLDVPAITAVAFDDNIDGDGDWRTNRCCNAVMFRNSFNFSSIAVTSTWVLTEDPTVILASDQVYYTRRWDYVPYSYTDQTPDGSAGGVPTPCSRAYYLDGIRAHEAGHALGLAHTNVQQATMYASAATCDESIVSLHSDDLDGRDFLYGAVDATDIAITSVSAPSPVVQGDVVSVDVTVENVGTQDVGGNITVSLTDGPTLIGSDDIVGGLVAGASDTVTFNWTTTTSTTVGDHTLVASHNTSDDNDTNDSNSTIVTVDVPTTDLAITSVSAPNSATQGDTVSVDVTVENVGNQDVGTDIMVDLKDGAVSVDTPQSVTGGLTAGASTTITFSWDTSGAALGDHTLNASHDFADGSPGNNSGSTSVEVVDPAQITLSATGYKVQGRHHADLTWSGASSNVEIYREGDLIAADQPPDGDYTDNIGSRGGGSYIYQVCEAGTSTCSNTATVSF